MQEEQEAVNSFTATKPEIRNTPRKECLAFFSLRTLFLWQWNTLDLPRYACGRAAPCPYFTYGMWQPKTQN